jgi:hypothetical protein
MSEETKTKTEVEKTITTVALSDNNTVTVELFPQKKRGSKDVYLSRAIPVVKTLDDVLMWLDIVPEEHFVAVINRDILREAALDASDAAYKDPNAFNSVAWLEEIKAYFDPRKQSSRGPTKAEITEAQTKYSEELTELTAAALEGNIDEAGKNRFLQIRMELKKLSDLLAKKTRRGKAPKTEAVKTAEPAAAAA